MIKQHGLLPLVTLIMLVQWASALSASPTKNAETEAAAWQSLQNGDAVILMRHALAPGTGDPTNFSLADCSTQRNLSSDGRTQAKHAGEVLRANGIDEATVLSSQWCRCQETATLLKLGNVETAPMLNSFYQNRSTEAAQTRQLRSSIRTWSTGDEETRILVTHQVNISALTGEYTASGEMLIVAVTADEVTVLARVSTEEF